MQISYHVRELREVGLVLTTRREKWNDDTIEAGSLKEFCGALDPFTTKPMRWSGLETDAV